jgi:hypothetical protein
MREEIQTRMSENVSDLQNQYVIFDRVISTIESTLNLTSEQAGEMTYRIETELADYIVILNEGLAGGTVVIAINANDISGMGASRVATMTITSRLATQEVINNIQNPNLHAAIVNVFSVIFDTIKTATDIVLEGDQNENSPNSDEMDVT